MGLSKAQLADVDRRAAAMRGATTLVVVTVMLALGVACAAVVWWAAQPRIITAPGASGRELYVAPDGKSYHSGSREEPLDLQSVFTNTTLAQPGDVVWLRGGRYVVAATSEIVGTPEAPIVVRAYPGERVVFEAASRTTPALTVKGSDTWYWGFEVTDTSDQRVSDTASYATGLRATSIVVFGPRTKFINLVVHDGEQGFGFWTPAVDAELYGNVIYNVGFEARDRGHGHSIYVQNDKGSKRIVDNILFNGHSFGVHAYTEQGFLNGLHLEGNTSFNHGALSRRGATANYLIRSKNGPPENPVFVANVGYYARGLQGRVADLWTPVPLAKGCTNLRLSGNFFAAPSSVALTVTCKSMASVRQNTFYGDVQGISSATEPENTYLTARPSGVQTFVRPNRFENGRAHLTVFNWDRRPTVGVDIAAIGLEAGQAFEVFDAQNLTRGAIQTGVFNGQTLSLPMTGLTVALPYGVVAVPPVHTGPEFGVFIVKPVVPADHD